MSTPTQAQAQIEPVQGETLDDLRIIASGLLADGIDVSKLTNVGRAELRQAIDRILALTAAAQVGETEQTYTQSQCDSMVRQTWSATIARCAQVAEQFPNRTSSADRFAIAAAIRKLGTTSHDA